VSAPSQHSVLTGEEALKLVSESRKLLHSSPDSTELRYLVEFRFLSWETVEKQQLGWVRDLEIPTEDGRSLLVSGLVIPCYSDRGELVQVKIRKLPVSQLNTWKFSRPRSFSVTRILLTSWWGSR
jgi:hypothetical protein